MNTEERNKQNARAYFKALEDMDVEAVLELFADDSLHENPYHSGVFASGAKGKAEIREYWKPVFPRFEKMEFPIEEIYSMEGNRVFLKFKGKIKIKDGKGWYNNDYFATFTFNDDGKIIHHNEIYNPITAAKGFDLLDKLMPRRYEHLDTFSKLLDSQQTDKVLECLSDDCLMQAGNSEPIRGKEAIRKTFEDFYPLTKSVAHNITDISESGDTLMHRGEVTYTRLDNSTLTVPVCDVFKMKDGKINEYYIYIDWSELFK